MRRIQEAFKRAATPQTVPKTPERRRGDFHHGLLGLPPLGILALAFVLGACGGPSGDADAARPDGALGAGEVASPDTWTFVEAGVNVAGADVAGEAAGLPARDGATSGEAATMMDAGATVDVPANQPDSAARLDAGGRDNSRDLPADAPLGADGRADARADRPTDAATDVPCTADVVCYTFGRGTPGTGTCRAGIARCMNGVLGPCTGQVGPTGEACNGLDDDCNGVVDDRAEILSCGLGACRQTAPACAADGPLACTPGTATPETCDGIDNDCDGAIDEDGCDCVHVAPTGDNASGTGSPSAPLRTITAAIALAASSGAARVCVSAGASCPAVAVYDEAITMRNGISLLGGYQSGAAWTRSSQCTTRIVGQNGRGVYFDASITAATVLDGFDVRAGADAINAAVTI